jgi:hypothetical protein
MNTSKNYKESLCDVLRYVRRLSKRPALCQILTILCMFFPYIQTVTSGYGDKLTHQLLICVYAVLLGRKIIHKSVTDLKFEQKLYKNVLLLL